MAFLRHHQHRSFASPAARNSGAPPAVDRRATTPMLALPPPQSPAGRHHLPNPMVSSPTAGQIRVRQLQIVGFVVVITEAIKENYEHSRTPVLLSAEGTSFDADDWVS